MDPESVKQSLHILSDSFVYICADVELTISREFNNIEQSLNENDPSQHNIGLQAVSAQSFKDAVAHAAGRLDKAFQHYTVRALLATTICKAD